MKLIVILLFLSSSIMAQVPFSFNSQTKIKASEVNENFSQINKKALIQLSSNSAHSVSSGSSLSIPWNNSEFAYKISAFNDEISFLETGIYEITPSLRVATDRWMYFELRDSDGTVKGRSVHFGGSASSSSAPFLANISDESKVHKLHLVHGDAQNPSGLAILDPSTSGADLTSAKSINVIIKKLD